MGQNTSESITLSFNTTDRHFYISGAAVNGELLPEDHELWMTVDPFTACTSSLKAAARFRPYADETCERVFERAFNKDMEAPPLPPLSFLDPHQRTGVGFILSRKRSYLAHAPGAGKTAQTIVASCLIRDKGQTVVIVPPSLTTNWEREIEKFSSHFRAFYTVGRVGTAAQRKSVRWSADFLIVPDSMLAAPWVYDRISKMKIKLLAVDEASRFKEPTSLRSLAFYGGRTKYRHYSGLFQRATRVVLLDGSPMPNRPMELWAPIYALDPEAIDCMIQQDFGFRFCGAKQNERGQWEFKHSSHERELRERLRKRFMHVVTEEELDHPERRRSMLFMNKDVRTPEMKAWEKRNLKLLKTTELSEELSQGEVATHRKELGLRKIDWVVQYILGRLGDDRQEKILVFAWHREVCQGLHRALAAKGKCALIMGGTAAQYREDAFKDFQEGTCRTIVGNIAAMGRGHNLQRADRVVFAEPSWSDELNRQCEKRAARRGRESSLFVRCEYVVVPDSLDERVMASLFAKQARFRKVIG